MLLVPHIVRKHWPDTLLNTLHRLVNIINSWTRYMLEFPNSNAVICWSFPIPMALFAGVFQFQCRYLLEFPNSNAVICWSFPIPMPLFAGVSQFQCKTNQNFHCIIYRSSVFLCVRYGRGLWSQKINKILHNFRSF